MPDLKPALPSLAPVLLTLAAAIGCAHDVEEGAADAPALFVAEGDALRDQLDEADGYLHTALIPSRAPFSRVGLRFDATGPVALDVRTTDDDGATFSDWAPVSVPFVEGAAHNALADIDGARATHLQVRVTAATESGLSFLAVDAFTPSLSVDEAVEVAGATEQGLAADGIARPREAWGARVRNCSALHAPSRITIHHTETPTNDGMTVAARLRQIQSYHIDVRGWCDVGYHFLVGSDGVVYQGRKETVTGAHVGGANANNVGVSFIGNFHSAPPSALMMSAGARIVRALSDAYGIALDRTKVKTHRELGDTDCPGDALQGRMAALLDAARAAGPSSPPVDDPPATTPPSASCAQVRVTASSLNVRPGPDTSDEPVGTLSEGDVVDVRSVVADGASVGGVTIWYEVDGQGLTGFVSGAYAECTGGSAPPPDDTPPDDVSPPPGDVYDGLDRGTAKIPRAGLANDTLQSALGRSTEPYGTVTTHQGQQFVRGRVSWFGGPNDTGVSSTETGAVTGERLRSLNSPVSASDATIATRPEDFYFIAMRWDYTPHGRAFWQGARILVVNPANGLKVVLRPVDWGPNTSTGRVLDISPEAISDLGATTDDELLVAFAAEGAPLGLVP